jgi:hypothetical protein
MPKKTHDSVRLGKWRVSAWPDGRELVITVEHDEHDVEVVDNWGAFSSHEAEVTVAVKNED